MYEEGYISLWVGDLTSETELKKYVQLDYDEDGDLIPSQMIIDFKLFDEKGDPNEYDESCMELHFYENKRKQLSDVLTGFSYDDQLLKGFEAVCGNEFDIDVNAVVLLYNYNNQINSGDEIRTESGSPLKFVGVIQYEI